jgi:hypothetical protein
MTTFLMSNEAAPGLSSTDEFELPPCHPQLADRERISMHRILVFALVVTLGAVASASIMLAMFAWTGASLS